MIKKIVTCHLWVYVLCAGWMAYLWDWPLMIHARDQYLLGIFYNENFKNNKDGVVYFSYKLRSHPTDTQAKEYLAQNSQ